MNEVVSTQRSLLTADGCFRVFLMNKLRVGILFGGRSGEHEVSLLSAASVLKAIDKDKYEVVPIGITKEGRWLTDSHAERLLRGPGRERHAICARAIRRPRRARRCWPRAKRSSYRPCRSRTG